VISSNRHRQFDRCAGRLDVLGEQQFGLLLDLVFGQVSNLDRHLPVILICICIIELTV
jgi:hypothetical protein